MSDFVHSVKNFLSNHLLTTKEEEKIDYEDEDKVSENFKNLCKFLKKKEFYNILKQEVQNVGKTKPYSAQPPKESDQGTSGTCGSHSMGKVIVDIANQFGLDCDQDEIIENLIKAFQPDKHPINLENFHQKNIVIKLWDSKKPDVKRLFNVGFIVQCEVVTPNWKIPLMSQADLDLHHTRLIVIENSTCHALYVESFETVKIFDINTQSYIPMIQFNCINSWGGEKTRPKLLFSEVSWVYYISLHDVPLLDLSSIGGSAEFQGCRLGIYQQCGQHNNHNYFKQLHSLPNSEGNHFFKEASSDHWGIGPKLDGKLGLQSINRSGNPPKKDWEFHKGKEIWSQDKDFRITKKYPVLCEAIWINASGPLATEIPPEVLGRYVQTADFSAGRPVFKNVASDKYLFVSPRYVEWIVCSSLENTAKSELLVASGCSPSLCPSEQRVCHSERTQTHSWMFEDKNGDWIEEPCLTITCETHGQS